MKEDDLANAIIQWSRENEKEALERDESNAKIEVYPEAHYNHYGNRGVVDLYIEKSGWEGTVYEFKSESAVQNVTGANEIIRQFNKMKEYFFRGSSHDIPSHWIHFELVFTPTPHNVLHLLENADMYASAAKDKPAWISDLNKDMTYFCNICMRDPDPENIRPVLFFTPSFDCREWLESGSFKEKFKETNEEIFEKTKSGITKYLD